jgi:uncharacterized spore protein YtfJ
MTDEENPVVEEEAQEEVSGGGLSSLDVVQSTFDEFLSNANVNAVYSKPVRQGDTVVITAAEVFSGFGFGIGEGSGMQGDQKGGGSGGGGGGQTFARPVAVVVCTPNGVSVQPIMDRTKLWMAALTAAGFMLTTLSKMRRPPRSR